MSVVRVLSAAFAVVVLIWLGNLVFMETSDAAKGWFDCGLHCTTTQRVSGGILIGGGLLLVLLLVSLVIAMLVQAFRRSYRAR